MYCNLERSYIAAEGFVEAVDATLNLICEHPTRWRNEYAHYYELGLKKYPYNLIYFIDANTSMVVVISIYHHSRSPKRKYRQ